MREWNLVPVGVCAVDVVEADGDLRYNFQRALACLKNLSVNRIAQRGDQSVNAGFYFLHDQALRRGVGLGVHFYVVTPLAQHLNRFPNIAGSKDTETFRHGSLWLESAAKRYYSMSSW